MEQFGHEGYIFRGKREDENIILLLRRHWITLFFRLIPLIFFLILVIIFNFYGQVLLDNLLGVGDYDCNLIPFINTFLFLVFWTMLFYVWVDYYLDVWIVTDQRVIDIRQSGFFSRTISELEHSKIQDVTSSVEGLIPTLFNYGNVNVQSAGEIVKFVFLQVPNPARVRTIIMQLQKKMVLNEKRIEGAILRGKM